MADKKRLVDDSERLVKNRIFAFPALDWMMMSDLCERWEKLKQEWDFLSKRQDAVEKDPSAKMSADLWLTDLRGMQIEAELFAMAMDAVVRDEEYKIASKYGEYGEKLPDFEN